MKDEQIVALSLRLAKRIGSIYQPSLSVGGQQTVAYKILVTKEIIAAEIQKELISCSVTKTPKKSAKN